MSLTKQELGEFVLRFLDQIDTSESVSDAEDTVIHDAVIVIAFDQPTGEVDEDGDALCRRGTMMRSTAAHKYRTVGLLRGALRSHEEQ